MGQVFFANKQQPAFLSAMGEAGGQYSDETARTIDEEVRRIIDEQYDVALQLLTVNRELLVKTVGQLLTDEVIEGDTLIELADALTHYPPLVWLRHPNLPAVQALPMTQAQVPANHPCASRSLVPFELPMT